MVVNGLMLLLKTSINMENLLVEIPTLIKTTVMNMMTLIMVYLKDLLMKLLSILLVTIF